MELERIQALGCIVCWLDLEIYTPAELHHPLKGGRRIHKDHVLALCYAHHRQGLNREDVVSRHPWKREFINRYGTEEYLFEKQRERYELTYGGQDEIPS